MEYQKEVVDGVEVMYSADWIGGLESEVHFNWYWHQASLVYAQCTREQRIVEIGVGSSLLSDLLKRRGWNLSTLDIDRAKKPDFCGNAADFDYENLNAEVVLAFEIFEHIPWSTFEKVIARLSASGVESIHFSLPWNEASLIALKLKLPRLREISLNLSRTRGIITTPAHFWELAKRDEVMAGKQLLSLNSLRTMMEEHGYIVTPQTRVGCIQYFSATKAA